MIVLPKTYYYHRYGIDSYWIREKRQHKNSLMALQLLLPYIDVLNENDVKYIFRCKHTWFENIAKHPIRLKTEKELAKMSNNNLGFLGKIKRKIKKRWKRLREGRGKAV